MNNKTFRSFVAMGALATACASWGCVADRPARNGVFNENQYIRKDFLIRSGATTADPDPGWFLKATIIDESIPNPLAAFDITDGTQNGGGENLVNFVITSDKLQMVSMRELSTDPAPLQQAREPEVVNAWPITNVDLKYRVNLDGETTNFYEENQELDWQVRQWVKLNLDKNDLSDLAPLGEGVQTFLNACTDGVNASTTLVPGSFNVDEPNNYMSWQVQVTVPVLFGSAQTPNSTAATPEYCASAYGDAGILFEELGRSNVTFTLLYSMVRAAPDSGIWTPARSAPTATNPLAVSKSTYPTWSLGEKDPIRKKYGVIEAVEWNRDPTTNLIAANEYLWRNNPNEPLVWYFAQGYPETEKVMWTRTGGIVDQTNQIFKDAGAKIRLSVLNYNDKTTYQDRQGTPIIYGDIRYNMIRWISDFDIQYSGGNTLAATYPFFDPRTGEPIATTISVFDWNIQEAVMTRLDFYLQTIGAEQQIASDGTWPVPSTGAQCQVGDTYPLAGLDYSVGGVVQTQHNEISTVYDKMQLYLHKPATTYGYLNPSDFVPAQSQDFLNALFKVLPYEVFRDPASNPFVIPEGGAGYYAPNSESAPMAQAELDGYAAQAQFNALMSQIDHGNSPYEGNQSLGYSPVANNYVGNGGADDFAAAQAFTDNLKALDLAYLNQRYQSTMLRPSRHTADGDTGILTNFDVFSKDARQCITNNPKTDPLGKNGAHWETRAEYVSSLVESYHALTVWHEFGHSLGLEHNFMGSVDKANFPYWTPPNGGPGTKYPPRIGEYSSSLMDYNQSPDRVFWTGGAAIDPNTNNPVSGNTNTWGPGGTFNGLPGWGPYDVAAIAWIYANGQDAAHTKPNATPNAASVSGQISATSPWNDPHGFNGNTEISYLYCTNQDTKYSPFCRTFDFGTTPSEIVASELDNYELEYKWRNFRLYNKFWDDGPYANSVAYTFYDLRRFLSVWNYDWSVAELIYDFPLVGIQPPANVPLLDYYTNLSNAFTNDISVANQLVAAFHEAIIQQSSGERPYITVYDSFYGDVVQQGITIDKILALQNWTSLYKIDDYDPNQAAGAYMWAATPFDSNYQSVAENTLDSMIGGQYDIFQYVSPLSISMFAQASHDINFTGRIETRDWVGGKSFGGPELDPDREFLDYYRQLAVNVNADTIDPVIFANCDQSVPDYLDLCAWDPRVPQISADDIYHSDIYNEFRGPDGRRYAWVSIPDRNSIIEVDRDRNTASYVTVRNYNQDVVTSQDDGTQGAYFLELPIKYTLDAFNQYN